MHREGGSVVLTAGQEDGTGALTAALQSTGPISLETPRCLVFSSEDLGSGPTVIQQASLLGSWPSILKSFHSVFFHLGNSL